MHVAEVSLTIERVGQACCSEPARDAGNAFLGGVSPTVEESVLRSGHADRTPSDAFPAAPPSVDI